LSDARRAGVHHRVSADDPERAQRFWEGLLEEPLTDRTEREGIGRQTRRALPAVGVHARGRGPGDTASLPYFAAADMAAALERVGALGGGVVHPGGAWSVCRRAGRCRSSTNAAVSSS
jgi:predicted enzyme related to lactoylglutathione lyase